MAFNDRTETLKRDPGMNLEMPHLPVFRVLLLFMLIAGILCKTDVVVAQQSSPDSIAAKTAATIPTGEKQPVTDSLGDPLPPAALLRFGTNRFHPPGGVSELALSPDQKALVSVGNHLIVWDPATGKERWRGKSDESRRGSQGSRYGAWPIAFSSDSSRFFTTSGQHQIAIWDISSGKHEVLDIQEKAGDRVKALDNNLSIDVTSDEKAFALGNSNGVVVFDRQGKVKFEVENVANGPFQRDGNDRLAFFGHYSCGRFSPDGMKLAVLTSDHPDIIRIYETATGRELQKISLVSKLVRLAFSPDSKQLVATERDSSVRLYDVNTGERLWSHTVELKNPFENYTSAVAYSPDGKTIAAAATDNRLYLLNPATGEEIGRLTGHHWYPWTLAFSADSKMLYSSGWEGTIRRWDVPARKQLPLPEGIHASEAVAASPDGRTIAYQDDRRIVRIASSITGAELRQVELPGVHFSQLQFSPDGQFLAGGGNSEDEVQVGLWNVKTGERVRFWNWPKGRDPHSHVEALCFTPQGDRLAAAVFRQSAAYIWDLGSDQQIAKLDHKSIYGLSFSPDGQTLATAGWDSIVRFWDTDTGKSLREFRVSTEKDGNGVKFAPVPAPNGAVNLNQRVGDLRMYAVCYAPEGGLIATAHMDGEVWIWKADTMQPQMRISLEGSFVYGALSFSPDGLYLATGLSGGSIKLWDPLTGQKAWDRGRHSHYVYTVGFGHDSRTLVSGSDESLCYLWDLRPAEIHPQHDDLPKLWDDLGADDSVVVYQAMWALCDSADRAVSVIAEKLGKVRTLVETEQLSEGISMEEHQRRRRLKKALAANDPKIELTIVARRAVSMLEQIGTPAAVAVLEDLAKRNVESDLGRLAASALNRHRVRTP